MKNIFSYLSQILLGLVFAFPVYCAIGDSGASDTPTLLAPPQLLNLPPVGYYRVGDTVRIQPASWEYAGGLLIVTRLERCEPNTSNCVTINVDPVFHTEYPLQAEDANKEIFYNETATAVLDAEAGIFGGSASTRISAGVIRPVGVAPSNQSPPLISGLTQVGEFLGVSDGTWSGSDPISFSYSWLRCDELGGNCITSGGNSEEYGLSNDDLGHTIIAQVKGTNAFGFATASSSPTNIVTSAATAPFSLTDPVITGTAQEGSVLTGTNGDWGGTEPITYTYQWQRCKFSIFCNEDIQGATSLTFTLTQAQIGYQIRLMVTATNSVGTAQQASAITSTVTAKATAPSNTQIPSVSGTTTVGQTLTASPGSWTGTAPITYSYQWQRCAGATCSDISNATGINYVLVNADAGSTIKVKVTASNSAGSLSALSAATGVIKELFNFTGFFPPVYNEPALNVVKAGSGIPVKFSLSGYKGLGILTSSQSVQINCALLTSNSITLIDTVNAGSSSLTYNATYDQYKYVWKTINTWKGSCRQLILTLSDGTVHKANFQFK